MKLGGHFFSSSLFFLNKSQTILKTFWHQFYDSMQTSNYDKTNTNLSEKLVIQQTRVCSCAGDYQLRPEKFGCFQEFIIVNITCLWLKVMDTTNCQTSIVSLNTSKTQLAINDRYNKLRQVLFLYTHQTLSFTNHKLAVNLVTITFCSRLVIFSAKEFNKQGIQAFIRTFHLHFQLQSYCSWL